MQNSDDCNQFICVLSSSFRTPSNSGDRAIHDKELGIDLMDSERLLRVQRKEDESDICDKGFDFKSFKFKKSKSNCRRC